MKTSLARFRAVRSGAAAAAAALLFSAAPSLRAEPLNRYDALGRTLMPLVSIFAPGQQNRALSFRLVVESMTGLPPALEGTPLELSLQPPDRFLLRAPWGGTPMALCRNGNAFWVTPGSRFSELTSLPPPKTAPEKDERPLAPILLPIPAEQLAFLPVLFVVEEAPRVDGQRVLKVRLMDQLAQKLRVDQWDAFLFLDESDPQAPRLTRVELSRPGWKLAARVEAIDLAPSLPPSTWEPASEDVVRLDTRSARRWLRKMGEALEKR
ncbi:MAG TPA: hypothetical protein VNQ90_21130 [Chthoniobacteraceae bacterium]|nr:hypothetical protein [Chthoniobacteraceae bacterium]